MLQSDVCACTICPPRLSLPCLHFAAYGFHLSYAGHLSPLRDMLRCPIHVERAALPARHWRCRFPRSARRARLLRAYLRPTSQTVSSTNIHVSLPALTSQESTRASRQFVVILLQWHSNHPCSPPWSYCLPHFLPARDGTLALARPRVEIAAPTRA